MKQSASIYKRGDRYWFCTVSKTTAGVGLLSGPVFSMPLDSTEHALGEAVIRSLNASEAGIPHPTDWRKFRSPILDAVGVKSWYALEKGAYHCSAETDGAIIRFVPSQADDGGGFAFKRGAFEMPATSSLETIGRRLLATFQACENSHPMNLAGLEEKLAALNLPKDAYCLTGGLPNEAYCIERHDNAWRVYYSERGTRSALKLFESEEEACQYFYAWISDAHL